MPRVEARSSAPALGLLVALLLAGGAMLLAALIYPDSPQGQLTAGRLIVVFGFPVMGAGLALFGLVLLRVMPSVGAGLVLGGSFLLLYGLAHLYGNGLVGDH